MRLSDLNQEEWDALIDGLRTGDEPVVTSFFRDYQSGLQALADRHISAGLRRRLDAEDVIQSVFRTFLGRIEDGQFILGSGSDLWRLLCAITLAKVRQKGRFHQRQKRAMAQEVLVDGAPQGWDGFEGNLADPGELVEFANFFEQIVSGLDDEERTVLLMRMEGHSNAEMASEMRVSGRTVRRIQNRLRARFEQQLG